MYKLTLVSAAVGVFLAVGPASAQQPASQAIAVYSYGYTPKMIHLVAGRPVTLTFTNTSGSGHDFTAKEFFGASKITSGAAPEGEIELKPHESKSITLVPRAGAYKAHCSHFMHTTFGMTGTITVN
jgi:plastocyanin